MIGIVPAAGYATRLGHIEGSKEMLDVDGAPVIERLVQRLEVGGCHTIRVVTRPEKHDIRRYAQARGLEVVLGHPAHLGESIAAGLGRGEIPDEPVAIGFPDSIWEPPEGIALIRALLDADTDVVLGLFGFPDPSRADVVVVDEDGRVRDILVKPDKPPSRLIWGVLVARAGALRGAERHPWPSDLLRPLVAASRVAGRFLSDSYVDIGTPQALAAARSDE